MKLGIEDIAAAGILPKVLGNLCCPRDFVECAAVSKTWQRAVEWVQITCIRVQPDSFGYKFRFGFRQWLTTQLESGRLTELADFQLLARKESYKQAVSSQDNKSVIPLDVSKLYGTALTVLAMTRLQSCHLSDGILLSEAAAFLPTSLQELQLIYSDSRDCGYEPVYDDSDEEFYDEYITDIGSMLAYFQHLSNLRKLCLIFEDYSKPNGGVLECIASHTMHELQHLEVHDVNFCLGPGCMFTKLFPHMQRMAVTVDFDRSFAQDNVDMLVSNLLHHVPHLTLRSRGGMAPGPREDCFTYSEPTLTISKSSVLQCLHIWSNSWLHLTLRLAKHVEVQESEFVRLVWL